MYNGVASPDHPPAPRTHLDAPLRVLYVGRLSARKGPDLVIDAARILRDRGYEAKVTLLGAVFAGYEWYEKELRAQAKRSGVEVNFAGFHTDIWPFLADADVLVVPSRVDEPFGNTAVEAILALRPVIASDSSGLREAAGGYSTSQLVAPDDAEAIAEALIRVRDEWKNIVDATSEARALALKQHAPAIYRSAVAKVVGAQ